MWAFAERECSLQFSWRRIFFVWEIDLLNSLKVVLEGSRLSEEEDGWWWKEKENGVFTV